MNKELIANTSSEWVSNYQGSGAYGALFTGSNNNTLFIPRAGYYVDGKYRGGLGSYFTSTPYSSSQAWYFYVQNSEGDFYKGSGSLDRDYGESIRPVVG